MVPRCLARATLLSLACSALAGGCTGVILELGGRPCEDGQCVDGFLCHPLTDLCVAAPEIACDGSGVCPSTLATGDPCEPVAPVVPCVDDATDCSQGCRVCAADAAGSAWSACIDPACGRVCPDDTPVCDAGICVCTTDSCAPGEVCDAGGCVPGGCGDGVRVGDEDCDTLDLGGELCDTLGFCGGALACGADCLLDTSGCTPCTGCGNGVREDLELCDGADLTATCASLGFVASGTLQCAPDCTYDTSGCTLCGNGVLDLGEACEPTLPSLGCDALGFETGTATCAPDCTYDVSACGLCGNAVIDGDELCEAGDVGGLDCTDFGLVDGTLACAADCLGYDSSGCESCGNGVLDLGEECDGALVPTTCGDLGCGTGTVVCSGVCTLDISLCDLCLPVTTGLQVWLDASDPTTLTVSSGRVVEWRGRVGGRNATGTALDGPLPVSPPFGIGSRAALSFAGAEHLALGDLSALFASAATLFVVARLNPLEGAAAASTEAYNLLTTRSNDTWWRTTNGQSDLGVFRTLRAVGLEVNMPAYGTRVFAVVSSAAQYELNIDGRARGVAAPAHDPGNAYEIGGPDDGTVAKFLEGHIGEILIYDRALSLAERAQVETYLFAKWKECAVDLDCGAGRTCSGGECGPGLHWAFDADVSPQPDGSGQGHAGTLVGGTVFVPGGRVGGGLDFDGLTGALHTDAADPVDFGQFDYAITLFVRSADAGRGALVYAPMLNEVVRGVLLELNPAGGTGQVAWTHHVGPTTIELRAGTSLNDNAWHHVAVVKEGLAHRLYIDGVLAAETQSGIFLDDACAVWAGAAANASGNLIRQLDGVLDEIRVYPHALTDAQVAASASP